MAIAPASGREGAAQDLHQRALAGAVLAEQGVDLARAELEVDAVEGDGGAEALADARHATGRAAADGRVIGRGSERSGVSRALISAVPMLSLVARVTPVSMSLAIVLAAQVLRPWS